MGRTLGRASERRDLRDARPGCIGWAFTGHWQAMRVAALFDIHANLPALEAVLEEVHAAAVDQVVIGGDLVPGPMMRDTLARVMNLGIPTAFIHGNGEL